MVIGSISIVIVFIILLLFICREDATCPLDKKKKACLDVKLCQYDWDEYLTPGSFKIVAWKPNNIAVLVCLNMEGYTAFIYGEEGEYLCEQWIPYFDRPKLDQSNGPNDFYPNQPR